MSSFNQTIDQDMLEERWNKHDAQARSKLTYLLLKVGNFGPGQERCDLASGNLGTTPASWYDSKEWHWQSPSLAPTSVVCAVSVSFLGALVYAPGAALFMQAHGASCRHR